MLGRIGLLDANKLLHKGLMIIKRDEKKKIIPFSKFIPEEDSNSFVLKEG